MVTEAGTTSLALLELSATEVAELALAESVTVQVVVPAPVMEFGEHVMPERAAGGLTVSCAVALPPRVAVRVAFFVAVTDPAVAVKLTVEAFCGTVMLAGTETALEDELSATLEPPVGAALEMVTVQLAWAPEARVAGVQLRADTTAEACNATVVVEDAEPSVAVMIAFWSLVTDDAVPVN
jgi:hypothetical protein